MANLTIPEEPQFNEEVEKMSVSTPAHADEFNKIHEKLFHNTLFLKIKNALLETEIAKAIAIALGRNQALVFDTYEDMTAWFENAENADSVAALANGTNLYIVDISVPDYWWSSVHQQYYELETQKADLTKYDNIIGDADISGLSDAGTITGALVEQNNNLSNINVSVNSDGKLVFTDKDGADTVLNFSPYPEMYAIAGYYGTSGTSFYYCYHSDDDGNCTEYNQVKGASTSTIFDDDNVTITHSTHQFTIAFKKSAVLKIYDSGTQTSVEYSAGDFLTVDSVWEKVPICVYIK